MSEQTASSILQIDKYMTLKPVNEDGLEFHSPFEEPFRLSGSAFQQEHGSCFRRLPLEPVINPRIDLLAWYTAGMQLQFKSSSMHVTIKAKLRHGELMYHMPQTGSSSFDLYVGGPGNWRSVRSASFALHASEFTAELYKSTTPGMREYLINFPLYNGVEELWIGLDENCTILPPSPRTSDRPLIVYGTSITQGGCASRPGLAWTNILSRWHNCEVYNFGFSGNGKGETQMAEFLSRIPDPSGFVLDYEANVNLEVLKSTLENFIAVLRKYHPLVPVTVVSLLPQNNRMVEFGADDQFAVVAPDEEATCEFQRSVVQKLRDAGDEQIFFIDGHKLLGMDWDECTMDGTHLNDLGFYRMAENINKYLRF